MSGGSAHPARWKADGALAFVALIWGTTFVAVKDAVTQISPLYFLSLRFSLAALCLLLMFQSTFRRTPWPEVSKGLLGGGVTGIFLWLGYVLQTFGLRFTSASNSGFLTGLYIVLVPLFAALVYRRVPAIRELGGLLIAAAGMIIMTFPEKGGWKSLNVGDLLTLGCAVAFAIHLLVLSYFAKRGMTEAVALGQIACAAILSTLSLVWAHPVAIWSTGVISAIVLTAIFATAIAFALQTWGQKHTTPTRTALIFALEPVFALVTAVIFGEHARWIAVAGGLLILGGILTVELKPAAPQEI